MPAWRRVRAERFTVLPIARVSGVLPPGVAPEQVTNIYVYHLILGLVEDLAQQASVDPAALADTTLARFFSGETGPDNVPSEPTASAIANSRMNRSPMSSLSINLKSS